MRGKSEAELVITFISFLFILAGQAKSYEMYKLLQENLIDQFKRSFKLQPNSVLVLKGHAISFFFNICLKGEKSQYIQMQLLNHKDKHSFTVPFCIKNTNEPKGFYLIRYRKVLHVNKLSSVLMSHNRIRIFVLATGFMCNTVISVGIVI